MKVKIGYEKLVFVDLPKEQEHDVLKFAAKLDVREVAMGLAVKGDKADMFDLIANLSFKYDLEIM